MTLVETTLRDATEEDAAFIGWVQLAASRSHLPRGIWEFVNDIDGDTAHEFLRRLSLVEGQFGHCSFFRIAEVDGVPAAAMCGFDPAVHAWVDVFQTGIPILHEMGVLIDEAWVNRAMLLSGCDTGHVDGAWIIENVATKPEFRRRGLVDRLLRDLVVTGRSRGFPVAQISLLIGNEPAKRAYEKAGFVQDHEVRSEELGAALGSPGGQRLVMEL